MDSAIPEARTDPAAGPQSLAAPIISCSPLAMVEVEGPHHRVCFVNPAFCRLLKRTRAELIGKPFGEIVRNSDRCVSVLNRVYETGEGGTHVETDATDSALVYWLYAMWPALGAGERPQRVVIQLTKAPHVHVTLAAMNEALLIGALHQHELKEAAEQSNKRLLTEMAERQAAVAALSAANAELRIVQDLAERASQAKDDFFAALSHELRTPLTPVLITAAALREDERLPAEVLEQVEMMERNIALEARLIDDLLDLTRITHGKLQLRRSPCDAATLIGYAVEVVRADASLKQIEIECSFEARPGGLLGDPTRLEQVIWNLLRNAVRFTPERGKISISTHDVAADDGKARLQIEVTDTGVGIDPSCLDRIFLPFDQGGASERRRSGGLGLGLSIARSIVEMHGGKIIARSAGLNRGSTFVIDLPRDDAPAPADVFIGRGDNGRDANLAPQKPTPLRLLLVEDHASTLTALSRLLQRDGHTVVTAANVAGALRAAAASGFDCVISDIGLPDGSGIELMTTLRVRFGLQGIALSGYGTDADRTQSREAGFVAHLIKPVAIADLRRAIASLRPPHGAGGPNLQSE